MSQNTNVDKALAIAEQLYALNEVVRLSDLAEAIKGIFETICIDEEILKESLMGKCFELKVIKDFLESVDEICKSSESVSLAETP